MSKKSPRIAERIAKHQGNVWPAHYLGYFECFNVGEYYEAHDVLEELWLNQGKAGSDYAFYKGLIQLAGAFVHLQKDRLKPAVALFKLCEANLRLYPAWHRGIEIGKVLGLAEQWRGKIEASEFSNNPLRTGKGPPVMEWPAPMGGAGQPGY